ncbi:MAG: sulfatase [Akkermansiaceae bacterium]
MHSRTPVSFFILLKLMLIMVSPVVGDEGKPNVLFIAIDDLRPELGCYGSKYAITPNIDQLAANGRLFERAYCQQAICHPSRTSLLTSTRPDTNGITHNFVSFRELNPDLLTLPRHFRDHGYQTYAYGKIFHRGGDDLEQSFSGRPKLFRLGLSKPVGFADPKNVKRRNQQFKEMFEKYGEAAKKGLSSGPAYESAETPDTTYRDGYHAAGAAAHLREFAKTGQSFFLALGLYKPHLNFVAPKKYWDLYDPEKLPAGTYTPAPKNGASMGLHASFELRVRDGIPKIGPIDEKLSRTLFHAYLACASYIDAQVGLVLNTLKETGLDKNTIVVFWGDHGWHLGDMGVWGKATNYEISTRVPLIISTPDLKHRGQSTKSIVELLDLFPTLCDLASLDTPKHLEGKTLRPLLDEPETNWNHPALTQYPNPALREWAANPLSPEMRETFFGPLISEVEARIKKQMDEKWDRNLFENHLMGYSLRTDRYRLIEWRDDRKPSAPPVFTELYDHAKDPKETKNIAAQNKDLITRLSPMITKRIPKNKRSQTKPIHSSSKE